MDRATLHRLIRRLQMQARRVVRSQLAGSYHSVFKGSGLSFEEVREYQPGDDIRRIDWNVTARLNAPFVKRFSEERQRVVLLAMDLSGSLDFTSQFKSKRQVAAELAAVLALAAAANNDRVGLLLFGKKVERYLPPAKRGRTTPRLLQEMLTAEATEPGTDLGTALDFLNRLPMRRAVVFLVGDFLGDGYEDGLLRLGRKHETLALRIVDPRETELPNAGLVALSDPETGETALVNTGSERVRTAFAARAAEGSKRFAKQAAGAKVDVLEVTTAGGHLDALAAYFERRRRRR